MENSIVFMILLQVALIGLNAIFACAEIAVISMNDTKLAKMASEGDKRAIRLAALTSQPARFLATIQVAITLSGFMGSAFAAENFSGVLVDLLVGVGVPIAPSVLDSIAVVFITIVLSYFTLVFGELVPKQVAMRKAEPLALALSGLISGIAKIFAPLVSFLTFSNNLVLRLMGIDPNAEAEEVSEEEIRMMVDAGSEKGTIDSEERKLIENVFEFDDLSADEIFTHRTDVIMLDLEQPMEVWKKILYETRHTRYPVCRGSADEIEGILNAKEYFRLDDMSRENVMKQAVRPPYFVLDTIKADVLFRNMKKDRQNMAVVLDEYGGVKGIITINDLVEQLVGDLRTDETVQAAPIERVGENCWKVHGSAMLSELTEEIGVPLFSDDFETFNGLIYHALESVPEDGSKMEINVCGLNIRITKIEKHQVQSAYVKVQKEAESQELQNGSNC